ncbi:uncharacterized protein LOC131331891 [Rhododendron vialii]|uniref:uncharacterized protein LOC131331891 n=1 Tax=Rhododendron vialii TaxID=182163 RepID=UPI00265E23F7|nr:uncharacterized protein LOC131331891 [Rhododendron vialii]
MFYSTYKNLGLSPDHLQTATTPLISFTGAPVWPLDLITQPVRAGSRAIDVKFVEVNSPRPYNIILGRAWLHGMKGVASTLHQVMKFVGWNADIPVLENVGLPAEQRSTEELIRMPITEDEGRYFLVGSSLDETERMEMFNFLKADIKVFAWTLEEMPGVDPLFASHSLNVDLSRQPVVQKVRHSAALHVEVVMSEVD